MPAPCGALYWSRSSTQGSAPTCPERCPRPPSTARVSISCPQWISPGPISTRDAREVAEHRRRSRRKECVGAPASLSYQRVIGRRGFLELSFGLGREASAADCCAAKGSSGRADEAGSRRIPALCERDWRELSRRSIDRFREKVAFSPRLVLADTIVQYDSRRTSERFPPQVASPQMPRPHNYLS